MTDTVSSTHASTNFIDRWQKSGAAERANCQSFLNELCDMLGIPHPDPTQPDDQRNAYVFERAATFALRAALAAQAGVVTPEQLAKSFTRARTDTVENLLQTLVSLGLACEVEAGKFAA